MRRILSLVVVVVALAAAGVGGGWTWDDQAPATVDGTVVTIDATG